MDYKRGTNKKTQYFLSTADIFSDSFLKQSLFIKPTAIGIGKKTLWPMDLISLNLSYHSKLISKPSEQKQRCFPAPLFLFH
jgi:hypothetical protein